MTPELGPIQPQPWWQQAATAIGMGLAAFILAWRTRGRKDRNAPYSPEKGAQPRVITRDEWHGAVQVINAWPGLSARVKRNEEKLAELVERWDEEKEDDREHRQRLEAHILRVEALVVRNGGGR